VIVKSRIAYEKVESDYLTLHSAQLLFAFERPVELAHARCAGARRRERAFYLPLSPSMRVRACSLSLLRTREILRVLTLVFGYARLAHGASLRRWIIIRI